MMIPLTHLLGFCAGQYLGDLIDAKIKAALFPQTINAGKKFLCFDGTIVSLARCQAIIAGAAV